MEFSKGWGVNHFANEEAALGTPQEYSFYFIGFAYESDVSEFDWFANYSFTVPHWFIALIFAIFPAIWLFKCHKRRKLGPNACPSCGYDLTGNETGVCPECGAVIAIIST